MEIDFRDDTNKITNEQMQLVEKLLQYAAETEEIDETAEMSVTFVNNEQIQIMNRDYRQKDAPTDVISFAMQEEGEEELAIVGEQLPIVLGDVIISVDKIKEQAEEYGHSFERELGFLSVHGLLQLLGYAHMTPEDEKVMFTKQEEILNEFGLQR